MSPSSSPPLLIPILVTLFIQHRVHADPTFLYQSCGSNGKNASEFASNATFQSNRNRLLSNLAAASTVRNGASSNSTGGFRNLTAGNRSDVVYGLFLCRGDVNPDVCQDCATTARVAAVQGCNRVRSTVIWYDECMLRFSSQSFFSTMDTSPSWSMWNTENVTGVSRFVQLVGETMNDVRVRAAADRVPQEKFATGEKNYAALRKLHALAQCTPDLSSMDCDRCLSTGIGQLPDFGSRGCRILMPSCNVRYETYPFYFETEDAQPPPPSPVVRPSPPGSGGKKKTSSSTIIAIVVPISVCLVLLGCLMWCRTRKKYQVVGESVGNEVSSVDSLQFDFSTIAAATNNFSEDKKIGEGGYGQVFMGTLPDGQEIAVKRLSNDSIQGSEQFKNEVVLVAKLQHRNLARLLGYCLQGREKILIYEFVPNKSLDYFLFDPAKQGLLDWSRRYKIVGGIARGILYLHEDSRLRIIHRDLKASNVLLDAEMNPKISDIGMARIFGSDQTQGNTSRIVGTYGYMPPEYAMHGHFSVKLDVFSFRVLILEIISGKKNNFYQSDGAQGLLSYAWKLWSEGRPLDLMEPTLEDTYSRNEVIRCIYISLLCVQEAEEERPTMATVVLLLNSYSVSRPMPQPPAFIRSGPVSEFPLKDQESDQSVNKSLPSWSINEASITGLDPR